MLLRKGQKNERQINKLQIVAYTLKETKKQKKICQDRGKHPLGKFTWYL